MSFVSSSGGEGGIGVQWWATEAEYIDAQLGETVRLCPCYLAREDLLDTRFVCC